MKQKVTLFVLTLFALSCFLLSACTSNKGTENNKEVETAETDKGFKTPEKVMTYFTQQIAKGDFKEAVKVFPINQKANHYNLGKRIDQTRAWASTSSLLPYPSEDDSFLEANKVLIESEAMKQIANMCFSLIASDEYLQETPVINDNHQGEQIAKSFLLHDLDTFEMTDFQLINKEYQKSEQYLSNMEIQNEIYGSDSFAEYEVSYRWNNQSYKGSVTFIQYGELWYIYSLQSNLAGGADNCYLEKK